MVLVKIITSGDILLVFSTGFSQMHVDIDETGQFNVSSFSHAID